MAHFFFAHQTRTPFMFILFCVYYHYKIVCCIYYIIMLDKCCHHTEARALERRTNSCSYHERYAVRCVLIAIFHLKWSHYSWTQVSTHSVTSDLVWIFLMLMIFVGEIGLEFYQSFFPSIIILTCQSRTPCFKHENSCFVQCESPIFLIPTIWVLSRLVSFVGILYIVHACKNTYLH